MCNVDDDGSRGATDSSDAQVNTGNDREELAPLDIRKVGGTAAPGSWVGVLEVSAEHAKCVRLFDGRGAGATEVLGPTTARRYTLPNLAFTTLELGMEAVKFAGERFAPARPPTFDGVVRVEFRIEDGGSVVHRQVCRLRVAPWIMPNHLDPARRVYLVDAGADGRLATGERVGNSAFRTALSSALSTAGVPLQTHSSNDVWMQDCMEVGFTSMPLASGPPNRHVPVVLRAKRDGPLQSFPRTLLTADFGYKALVPLPATPPDRTTTYDSHGNLETTPPFTSRSGHEYPFGRIYYGPGSGRYRFDERTRRFLSAQRVQAPFQVDTSWLTVGHVDEIISFVPAPTPKGWKLLLASPRRAYAILADRRLVPASAQMLIGRDIPVIDPVTDDFLGYRPAQTTVGDFLRVGIPALGTRGSGLDAFNLAAQAHLDSVNLTFQREAACAPSDIIEVPVIYFPYHGDPGLYDALTGGMANMLVVGTHCVAAKAFGPIDSGGVDIFERNLRDRLSRVGVTVDFVDDWYPYHVKLGEVHCGTNTRRAPRSTRWWRSRP